VKLSGCGGFEANNRLTEESEGISSIKEGGAIFAAAHYAARLPGRIVPTPDADELCSTGYILQHEAEPICDESYDLIPDRDTRLPKIRYCPDCTLRHLPLRWWLVAAALKQKFRCSQ
jgi:hypothetical protein